MLRTFQTNGKGSFSTKTLLCFFLFLIGISKSHAQTTLFSEDWASSSFATNGWTFDPSQGAWVMGSGYTPTGATTPNAYFNWTPSYTNYSYSLVSPVINGSTYVGMTLDYKLQLNNYSASTLEQFKIEYKKTWETAWTLLTNYSNAAGSFNIAPTNVPISGTDTANYQIRFVAYGVNSFNINGWGLDDIAIKGTPSTLCFGTPTVGTLSGPSSVCPNTAFTVSSTGYTSATGISFQWESSPSGLGVWTAVGTNSPSLSVTPITAATDYRLTISCANGGGTDVSPAITVNVSAYYNCYCSSSASYTGDEEILNVTLGTLNNSSTCATTAPGSGSVNQRYSNYSTLAPTVLYTGATNPLSVQVGTCGGNYGNWTKVYIDYNHDGSFTGVGEEVYSSTTYTTGPHFEIGSITIPSTATTGVTGMRVINVETTSSLSVNPCGTYGWGETEDYLIDIQTPPTCAGTPSLATVSGPVSVCPNASFNVSATGYSQGLGITYQWETAAGSTNAWSPIAGATNPYLTVTGGITGAMDYHLITTCSNGGAQDVSNTTTVATMPFYVCYCGPATGISLNSYTYNIVTNVSILGTPLNNTTSLVGTGGYTLNYPTTATTTTSLSQGLAYSINVSMPFTGYYVGVWVDFDANGSFDASEFVSMSGTGTTLTGTFTGVTVPLGRGWPLPECREFRSAGVVPAASRRHRRPMPDRTQRDRQGLRIRCRSRFAIALSAVPRRARRRKAIRRVRPDGPACDRSAASRWPVPVGSPAMRKLPAPRRRRHRMPAPASKRGRDLLPSGYRVCGPSAQCHRKDGQGECGQAQNGRHLLPISRRLPGALRSALGDKDEVGVDFGERIGRCGGTGRILFQSGGIVQGGDDRAEMPLGS